MLVWVIHPKLKQTYTTSPNTLHKGGSPEEVSRRVGSHREAHADVFQEVRGVYFPPPRPARSLGHSLGTALPTPVMTSPEPMLVFQGCE
jgi:hypothetical protein